MEAAQVMRLRKIRRIPIVVGGKLVGLLTEGDLKRAEPSTLSDTQEHFTEVMEGTQVNRIMIENLADHDPRHPPRRGRAHLCGRTSTAPCPCWRARSSWASSPTTT